MVFQENIVKFPLDELLVNYLRVRALLCSAKRHYQVFLVDFCNKTFKLIFLSGGKHSSNRTDAKPLDSWVWKGGRRGWMWRWKHCDTCQVLNSLYWAIFTNWNLRKARTAEFCDSTASALKQHLKAGKEKLAEDYSLYCWRAEVLR